MKKGDLVRFEYLTNHHNGVGWEFHKGVGLIIDYSPKNDSYIIMTEDGKIVERLDMQIDLIVSSEEKLEIEKTNEGKERNDGKNH
jgi:hypothetical protein